MKKLILKNLKAENLSTAELKKINGGTTCSAYYCEFVNPNAACCGGGSDPDPDPGNGNTGGGTQCSTYYCTFVNPSASCC